MACSDTLAVISVVVIGSFRTHFLASFRGMLADGMWRDAHRHYKGKPAAVMIWFYTQFPLLLSNAIVTLVSGVNAEEPPFLYSAFLLHLLLLHLFVRDSLQQLGLF